MQSLRLEARVPALGGASWDWQLCQRPLTDSKNRIGCLYKLNSWEVPKGKGFPGKESKSWEGFVLFFLLMGPWLMTQGNEEHISPRISHCPPQPILHTAALFKTVKLLSSCRKKFKPFILFVFRLAQPYLPLVSFKQTTKRSLCTPLSICSHYFLSLKIFHFSLSISYSFFKENLPSPWSFFYCV